jgi:SAM-dependent methyltransferase
MRDKPTCWCGAEELVPFSPGYLRCPTCETLVSARATAMEMSRPLDEEQDFDGLEHWSGHAQRDLDHPSILRRARTDLSERCLPELRMVLKYKLPPARMLHVGSGHGGFVAILRWAGFEATGLELDPFLVEYARIAFQVPMLLGPVEDQRIEPGSMDAVLLMDALECLPDPVLTMRHCLDLLKPDGVMFVQAPHYRESATYEDAVGWSDRTPETLRGRTHRYLFSRSSLRALFARLGADHICFEPAVLADSDVLAVVSRAVLSARPSAPLEAAFSAGPTGPLVMALLDVAGGLDQLRQRLVASESDRAVRLQQIEQQARRLGEVEAERNDFAALASTLRQQLAAAEADRAARLELILAQGQRLGELERALGKRGGEGDVERAQRLALQRCFQTIQRTRAYKLLRKLGRWRFMDQIPMASSEALALPSRDVARDVLTDQNPAPAADGATPERDDFETAYVKVRAPKKKGAIFHEPGAADRIVERLLKLGLTVRPYQVDAADYRRYVTGAGYHERFSDYHVFNRTEKSLEHYLAAKLLALDAHDLYIDVASEHSPAPDIYRRLFGLKAYRQDLAYRPGVHGNRIGGDAAHMPVPDGFATKMTLHCSFEHFEEESDIGFVREAGRVLRPGGMVCILPLYLFEEYAVQTDPEVAVREAVAFERDAIVYCARGWGNRHGRFYDPEHLASRIVSNAGGMEVDIYRIVNVEQIDRSCYVQFAMLLRKP